MAFNFVYAVAVMGSSVLAANPLIPVIDPTLTPSFPGVANISRVDWSLSHHDRIVLLVDEKPFFYNGVQLRADKQAMIWNMTDDQIEPMFKLAATDGFTVVNTQILWLDIQPDATSNATEATYIRGGSDKDKNFSTDDSLQISYDATNETNQALTYLKFNFTNKSFRHIDAARVRVYVNAPPVRGVTFSANLYGIADNGWSASNLTWNNAPNHDGINVSGNNSTDYWLTASSPSWDPIKQASYYDFDASDFITNHVSSGTASFIFQAQVNDTSYANGATLDGIHNAHPPSITVSSTQSFNWTRIDKLLSWATAAGVKLEFIWFGSDSTSSTQDSRVPYFVFQAEMVRKIQSDGTVVPVMLKNQGWGYGVYQYLADKNDLTLRAREKRAIRRLMDHVADWDRAHGNKKTLVGVDVANENSLTHIHAVGSTVWQNPKTWAALGNFSSRAAFLARTQWEYTVNLANGVKESRWPVWTRLNTFNTAEETSIDYNEKMRLITGTSLDFVGMDPYSTSLSALYSYGHETTTIGGQNKITKNWSQGHNLPMVMENSGAVSSAESLLLATLAGGAIYNVYELMGPDGFGLYYPKSPSNDDFTPVVRGSYVADVRRTNNILKSLGPHVASKRPSGAGGTRLFYLNPFNNGSLVTAQVQGYTVGYTPSTSTGVGIVVSQRAGSLLFASTRNGTFTVGTVTPHGLVAIEYGHCNSAERFVVEGHFPYRVNGTDITIDITTGTLVHIRLRKSSVPA
jgi:hypothetical protein